MSFLLFAEQFIFVRPRKRGLAAPAGARDPQQNPRRGNRPGIDRADIQRSAEKRAAKGLRWEGRETARGDEVPDGRFARSAGLELLRPVRFAA